MLRPTDLRCEYRSQPLGLDELCPRFSWRLEGDKRGAIQTSYRVLVASASSLLDEESGDLWDSDTVRSDRSSQIAYEGVDLSPATRYFWRVRVEDNDGVSWSETEWFETGMLGSDWEAQWITLPRPDDVDNSHRPCPYLRRRFELPGTVDLGRVYVTALGLYRLFINGSRVGSDHLAPGWTDYRRRIPYQTLDVTGYLRPGANCVGLVLADGWYSGYLGTARERELYGDLPQALLRMVVESASERLVVVSDSSWEASFGPHLASDIYLGETYDASKEFPGWTLPEGSHDEWKSVVIGSGATGALTASAISPVCAESERSAIEVHRKDESTTRFDFGQNLAGWTKVNIDRAEPGCTLVVRHAEMLDGEDLYVDNLRHAKATDIYTTKSGGQSLEPWFSYHGFRYAEVQHPGLSAEDLDVTSVSARTPVDLVGSFECSNDDLNKLHEAIVWSYKSNWLEVPTDCPNRDERLGWTGDATICANTACYLMDAASFYSKWMQDVEDAKTEEGLFTDVAPAVPPWTIRGAPGWGDGGVVVPWMLHRFYGDNRILERHLTSMRTWVDRIWSANLDLLWTREVGSNYGDWLEVGSYTIKEVISTCLFARSAGMVADALDAVGDGAAAKTYRDLHEAIGKEFRRAYLKDGRIAGDTQSSYVLALACGVLDPGSEQAAAQRIVELIRENGGRMSTGFLATEHLLPVLADHGYVEEAYALLEAHHFPSWLHFIDNGATTMWEHWDSWTPDKGFKDPFMNSFNHCSLGSVGRFFYEYVGGLRSIQPGFKKFEVYPRPGGSLASARASYDSPAGRIVSEWQRSTGHFQLRVQVPPNTQASVVVPKGDITESGGPIENAEGLLSVDVSGEQAFLEIGSGTYLFDIRA